MCAGYAGGPIPAVAAPPGGGAHAPAAAPVKNKPPTAVLLAATPAYLNVPTVLNGAGSTDSDGTIVKYEWDINNDGVWEQTTTSPSATVVYTTSGRRQVNLRVTDDAGATSTDKAQVTVMADVTPPTAAITVQSTALVNELVTVDGSGSSDVNGIVTQYRWDFQNDGVDDLVSASATAQHSWPVAGTYQIRLTVVDASGLTGSSTTPIVIQGIVDQAPQAPTGVAASDRSADNGGAVVVAWSANAETDLAGYRVYRSTSALGPFTVQVGQVSTTSFTDLGLTDGTTYHYVVTAYDLGGNESPVSPVVSATPVDDLAPATPTGVAVADVAGDAGDQLDASWQASPESDLAGYRLRITGDAAGTSEIVEVTAGTTAHRFSGLSAGRSYSVEIAAYDTAGNASAYSAPVSAIVTDELPPAVPFGVNAVDRPDDEGRAIQVWWNANTENDLSGYRVYRETMSTGFRALVASLGTVTAWTDENCIDGVDYGYTVAAVDSWGHESAPSDVSIARSFDTLPPLAVGAGAAADVPADQGGAASVTWVPSASADIAGYRVDCVDADGVIVESVELGIVTGHSFSSLTTGVRYSFVVYARDNGGNVSPASPIFYATPLDNLAPATPAGLAAVDVVPDQGGSILVSWSANTESDLAGYTVTCLDSEGRTVESRAAGFATSAQFDGLVIGAGYEFEIVAQDVNGNASPASDRVVARGSDELAPLPVTATAADHPSDQGGVIDVTWSASGSSDCAGYTVYRDGAEIANVSGLTYADTVVDTLAHAYTVRARDASNNLSDPSSEVVAAAVDNLAPVTPGNFTVIDEPADDGGAIRVTFAGSPDPDVDCYHVCIYDSEGVLIEERVLAALDFVCCFSGLPNSVPFSFSAHACDVSGNESAPTALLSAFALDNVAPAAPADLTAVDTPNDFGGSISLAWTAAAGADTYSVLRAPVAGTFAVLASGVTATTYDDTTAVNGVTYRYAVVALDAGGNESPATAEASAVAVNNDTVPPSAPGTATAFAGDSYVSLSWIAAPDNAGVHHYEIWSRIGLTAAYQKLGEAPGMTYARGDLLNGSTYWFKVRAVDANGNVGPFGEAVSAMPKAAPVSTTVQVENTDTRLAWSGAWQVYWDTRYSGGTSNLSKTSGARCSLSFDGTNVIVRSRSTMYSDRGMVRVYLDGVLATTVDCYSPTASWSTVIYQSQELATGPHSLVLEVTGQKNPASADCWIDIDSVEVEGVILDVGNLATPTGATISDTPQDTGHALTLRWNANAESDLAGYRIYRSTSRTGTYSLVDEVRGVTTYTDRGLDTGVTYYYQLTALDASGHESGRTAVLSGAPVDDLVPSGLMGLAADGSASLAWVAPSYKAGVVSYEVWMKTGSVGTYEKVAEVASTSHSQGLLTNGTSYSFKVRVKGTDGGLSGFTAEETVVPVVGSPLTTRVEDTDGSVVLGGGWVRYTDARYSAGTTLFSQAAGARATITFSGSAVTAKVISTKSPERGMMKVYLDGVLVTTVDCYSATALWATPVYQVAGLSGQHTIAVEAAGTKNPASLATYIDFDCFELVR